MEVFSPGCVEPVGYLSLESWPEYLGTKLARPGEQGEATDAAVVRSEWGAAARERADRRARKCRERRRTVVLLGAASALHSWDASSQILVKGEPPLTPSPVIGVAL